MLRNQREQEILKILNDKKGFVSVRELCESIYASESSIRRTLTTLEKKKIIARSYGGAELLTNNSGIMNFNQRTLHDAVAKTDIAKKAAKLIKDDSIIFLDQSSTSIYLANEIKDRNSITVVTNNTVIMSLMTETRIKTICSGGYMSTENRNCLIGGDACRTFESIYADYMFFSAKSISENGIITDCDREEVIIRNIMLANSAYKVFLCSSEKFRTASPYRQCCIDDIDCLVSEDDKYTQYIRYADKVKLL